MFDLEPWQLDALRKSGFFGKNRKAITDLARKLAEDPGNLFESDEFKNACGAVGVDPEEIDKDKMEQIKDVLNE